MRSNKMFSGLFILLIAIIIAACDGCPIDIGGPPPGDDCIQPTNLQVSSTDTINWFGITYQWDGDPNGAEYDYELELNGDTILFSSVFGATTGTPTIDFQIPTAQEGDSLNFSVETICRKSDEPIEPVSIEYIVPKGGIATVAVVHRANNGGICKGEMRNCANYIRFDSALDSFCGMNTTQLDTLRGSNNNEYYTMTDFCECEQHCGNLKLLIKCFKNKNRRRLRPTPISCDSL